MTCACKESCAHQKTGMCGLSESERLALKSNAKTGPRDGDGSIPGG